MSEQKKPLGLLVTQRQWRIVGIALLAASALMVWFGVRMPGLRASAFLFFGYWGVFVLLLLAAVYTAILDMRYIRAQYRIAQRDLFRETFGDEQFRRELRKAQAEEAKRKAEEARRN